MATPRTTAAQVKGVLLRDYDTVDEPSLTPFITAANLFISRVRTCAIAKDRTLTTDELTVLETWVSAHLYCMSDRIYSSRSNGGASGSFAGQTGMAIEATFYGQTAMMLDSSGCVENLAKRQRAGLVWLGKPKSEQIPIEQRN